MKLIYAIALLLVIFGCRDEKKNDDREFKTLWGIPVMGGDTLMLNDSLVHVYSRYGSWDTVIHPRLFDVEK